MNLLGIILSIMGHSAYRAYEYRPRPKKTKTVFRIIVGVVLLLVAVVAYKVLVPTPLERAVNQLQFDGSVTSSETQKIQDAIKSQTKTYDGSLGVSVATKTETDKKSLVLSAYVPVTGVYSPRQSVRKQDFSSLKIYVDSDLDERTRAAIAGVLGVGAEKLIKKTLPIKDMDSDAVALLPADRLTSSVKLLKLNGSYYLDSFKKGAIFRQAQFSGPAAQVMDDLKLNNLPAKDSVLKVNMTGVTAITRMMMRKLTSVKDPKYFSAKIGSFLADADITHVSNEVSFKSGCTYSDAVFCSPPAAIETLKDSGVDLVELTGNHNNDTGSQYNTNSIKLYQSLGWDTFGGGLNTTEAAKPFIANKKQSKVAFLAYNYPDSPSGGAIAGEAKAGANSFNFDKIKSNIEAARQKSDFVIVDVQFWECYAYPDGYVEFPECDLPIPTQKDVFRKIADLGADMVIGTQAHQPQTYEVYNNAPIYYGLGNLYFDQTQWPGTERGIILTHYFSKGKLLQTKLSPTEFDAALQTHLVGDQEAVEFLDRLARARDQAQL